MSETSASKKFATIPEALDDLRAGKMIVLVDDEDRENEGDLILPAEKCTPEVMNFMMRFGRGVPFVATTGARFTELAIPMMTKVNTARHGTAMGETVDAAIGATTGVSAADRCATVRVFVDDNARPGHLARPGHVLTIRAEDGGTLVRAGHTEAIVDLCLLAGFKAAGVGCEIVGDDGEMQRRPALEKFCAEHNLKICTIADLISYRLRTDKLISRLESIPLPTRWGDFQLIAYHVDGHREPHLALTMGGIGIADAQGNVPVIDDPVLVRVHSECLTGDVFGSERCDCGPQLDHAMQKIADEGRGVLLYLRQEGRGIGLEKKLAAYRLQDEGYDTVEANLKLGLPADKRDFGIGSQILRDLGLRKLRLMTNNPRKIHGIDGFGLQIVESLPIRIPSTEHNQKYLEIKRTKLGHML